MRQGVDAGGRADPVALIQSTGGTPFAGVLVRNTAILFPVDLGTPFASLSCVVPANRSPVGGAVHLITGLAPGGGYDVATQSNSDKIEITITPGRLITPIAVEC